jgi:hypothetical protein
LTTNPLPPQRGVVIPQVTLYSSVKVHPGWPAESKLPAGLPCRSSLRPGSPPGSPVTRAANLTPFPVRR